MSNFTIESIIEKLGSIDYKKISSKLFIKEVVEPLNMIGYDNLEEIVLQLEDDVFDMLRARLWNEQCPDVEEYPEDPEKLYEDTLPMVILLERLVKFRLPICTDARQKNSFLQQLAILKIQLNPSFLNGVTAMDEDDDIEEDDEESISQDLEDSE